MANAAVGALTTVKQFYQVLSLEQPSSSVLDAMAARVDNGTATLGETLKTLYLSPTVQLGPAVDTARLFFLVFDRAPDTVLFASVMDYLRTGGSMEDVAAVALDIPGLPLSNAGAIRDADFVDALLHRGVGYVDASLASQLTDALTLGLTTRAQMLSVVASKPGVAVAPPARVETALLYLAAAGQEANSLQLNTAAGSTDGRIIDALAAAGLSATGGGLALSRVGDALKLYGDMADALVLDASTGVYKLGGKTTFKVFYSPDGGLSGSVVDFHTSMVSGVAQVDASSLVGKGKLTFLAHATQPITLLGPDAGMVATGSAGGSDWLVGSTGADTFYLTAGADTVTGGLGDDRFVLPASTVYQMRSQPVTVTDFGNGKDVLDFSRLLNKNVDITKLDALLAVGDTRVVPPLGNGGVVVVENNGVWTSGSGASLVSRHATATDVEALFGAGNLLGQPTRVMKSIVITADTRSSADVWLILNNTNVSEVTAGGLLQPQEIFHVAHLIGSWNASLEDNFPVVPPLL